MAIRRQSLRRYSSAKAFFFCFACRAGLPRLPWPASLSFFGGKKRGYRKHFAHISTDQILNSSYR